MQSCYPRVTDEEFETLEDLARLPPDRLRNAITSPLLTGKQFSLYAAGWDSLYKLKDQQPSSTLELTPTAQSPATPTVPSQVSSCPTCFFPIGSWDFRRTCTCYLSNYVRRGYFLKTVKHRSLTTTTYFAQRSVPQNKNLSSVSTSYHKISKFSSLPSPFCSTWQFFKPYVFSLVSCSLVLKEVVGFRCK